MGYVIESKKEQITSNYGNREFYFNGSLVKDFHTGIDIIKQYWDVDKIIAFTKGKVIAVRTGISDNNQSGGYGNYIKLQHNDGFETLYCHLKEVYVNEGDIVEEGQVIGFMGQSGYATGIHLHFEVRKNGQHTNPSPYLQGQPIPGYEIEVKPSDTFLKVGDRVVIQNHATHYATGEAIPSQYLGKIDTIMQIGIGKVLLKDLYSWVLTQDVALASAPKKDLTAAANRVKMGTYGNEPHRTNNLLAEGYTMDEIREIQNIVNRG